MMTFTKNINDLIGILTLLVLTTSSQAANIDCNGKPFHCLNSTHFMICVDLGSGVSSTIDDFVIPCPPTTVCKGTNRFECEFADVTTRTTAPSVAPIVSVSESTTLTTPVFDVTTSIPFEEYYNTLSTTTLSEDILLAQRTTATESTVQPATDMIQNIDVIISESEFNSTSDIANLDGQSNLEARGLKITNNNNITSYNASYANSDTTENVIISEPKTNFTSSENITIAENTEQTTIANVNYLSNNVTILTLSQMTEAATSISSTTEPSLDVVENFTVIRILAKVTEPTINTPTPENPLTTISVPNDVNASFLDFFSNTTEVSSAIPITEPDTNNSFTEAPTDIIQNEFTLLITVGTEPSPITTELTTESYIKSIPETTEKFEVIASIPLTNNVTNDTTDTRFLEATAFEGISNKDVVKNNTNAESMLARVAESTTSEDTVTTPIVDVVQNSLKTLMFLSNDISVGAIYATENPIVTVTEPETNFNLSVISSSVTTTLIDNDKNITPTTSTYISETTENINETTSEPEATVNLTDIIPSANNMSLIDKLVDTITQSSFTEVRDTVQSLNFEQNNITTHNATNPILLEETTPSLLNVRTNTLNALNDSKASLPLSYDSIIHVTNTISNVTEIVNVTLSGPKSNKTFIEIMNSFSDIIDITTTESISPSTTDSVNKYMTTSSNTTLLNAINDKVTDPPIDFDVMENINEPKLSLNVTSLITPNNETLNNFITRPVIDVTTEPINTSSTETVPTVSANIFQYDTAIPMTSNSSASFNNKDVTVAVPIIVEVTENPTFVTTEYHNIQPETTSNERFSGQSLTNETNLITPKYTQDDTVLTEHTVTTEYVSINTLANEINKSSTANNNVVNENITAEVLVDTSIKSYTDFIHDSTSVTDIDSTNFVRTTMISAIETTVLAQNIESTTYSNVNRQTDADNIGNQSDRQTATNADNGDKPLLSEIVISPASEVTFNDFTNSFKPVTDDPVPKLISSTEINTLNMNTESILSINNQITYTQEYSALKIKTNDSVISVNKFIGKESFSKVNESSSDVQVLTTTRNHIPTSEKPQEPSYFIEAKFVSIDDTTANPVSEQITVLSATDSPESPITTTNIIVTPEPTTLGTTLTVTEPSHVMFSETTNEVPVQTSITESTVSSTVSIDANSGTTIEESPKDTAAMSTSSNFINDSDSLRSTNNTITDENMIKESVNVITENKSKDSKKINTVIGQDIPTITTVTQKYITSPVSDSENTSYAIKTSSPSTIDDATTAIVNHSSIETLPYTENGKDKLDGKNILLEIIIPSLSVHNISSKTVSISDTKPTSISLPADSDFDTNSQKYAPQQKNSNPIKLDTIDSSYNTDRLISHFVAAEEIANRSEISIRSSESTLLTSNTVSTDDEALPNMINAATTQTIPMVSTPIPLKVVADTPARDSSKTTTENIAESSTRQESYYTEPVINYIDANIHTMVNTDKEHGFATQAKSVPDVDIRIRPQGTSQTLIEQTKTLNVQTEPTVKQMGLKNPSANKTESSPLHNGNIITDTQQSNAYLDVLDNTGLTKTKETQSFTAELNSANGLESKVITQSVNTSSISNINHYIPEGIPNNKTVQLNTNNDKNDNKMAEQNVVPIQQFSKVVSKTNTDNIAPVETQISQKVYLNTGTDNTPVASLIQDNPTIEPITESWRATMVTKPYIQITSPVTTTQLTENTEESVNNTAQIVSKPNVDAVVSKLEIQQVVIPQNVTYPNMDEKLETIDVKTNSTLRTESISTVPQISENNVLILSTPALNTLAPNLGLVKIINILNKINESNLTTQHDTVPLKTESTNAPKDVSDQTTEQTNINTPIGSNLDKGIIMIDAVKTEAPALVENKVITDTHSGISALPKSKVEESEKIEASESVEKSETSESIEGIHKIAPVLDQSKTTFKAISNVNKDIYQIDRTTESYKLPVTNNKIPHERTIEMVTKKIEDAEKGYPPITNIEFVSSTIESPSLAVTHVADAGLTKEKTDINGSIVTAHSSNETSTTRYFPKSTFANTYNSPHIAVPVTNPRNFVCKLRGRFSDSKDCRKFYICIGKPEPIEGTCPNNTVFSEQWKQCTKNVSHCVRNNQFQCVWEGRFSDYLKDNIYYICVKNNVGTFIRFKLQCQSGYHLNKTSVHCELNTESSRSTSQQSNSDVSKNSSDQSMSVKSQKILNESSNEFECKKEGKFPDEDNCRKYYVCTKIGKSQFKRKIKMCDSDELFHKDKKKCVDADSYECR